MNDRELRKIVKKGNKKLKQNLKTYKNDVQHDYDVLMIAKFKREEPEKVEKIKQALIKDSPHLKYFPERLERRVNRQILPPILEKSDGYFYSITETINGEKKNKTQGGYHMELIECINEEVDQNSEKKVLFIEIIESLLDNLTLKEIEIIKVLYNVIPYHDCCIDDLKVKYGLTDDEINIHHDSILKKLKEVISGTNNTIS